MASRTPAKQRTRRPPGSLPPPPGTRYRLIALSPTVQEVVEAAGGLLFDRAAAGWEVVVFVDTETGYRPLEVLGVTTVETFAWMTRDVAVPSASLVLASSRLHDDLRVRRYVSRASRCSGDVAVWGGSWHPQSGELPGILEFGVSAAGRAYKHQALLAANDHGSQQLAAFETFHRVRATSARRSISLPQ